MQTKLFFPMWPEKLWNQMARERFTLCFLCYLL